MTTIAYSFDNQTTEDGEAIDKMMRHYGSIYGPAMINAQEDIVRAMQMDGCSGVATLMVTANTALRAAIHTLQQLYVYDPDHVERMMDRAMEAIVAQAKEVKAELEQMTMMHKHASANSDEQAN